MFFSKKKKSALDVAKRANGLSELFSPANFPEISKETIKDLFFYMVWVFSPAQHSPLLLSVAVVLMTLSFFHRLRDYGTFSWIDILPSQLKWVPFIALFSLFILLSMIWSSNRSYTFLAWLYGAYVPLSIVIIQSHFIQNLHHFRRTLAFFLYYIVFIFIVSDAGRMFKYTALAGFRYDWAMDFFTSQAASTWLVIIFPLFFTLIWHHDKQFHKFSTLGLGLIVLLGFLISKIGFWIVLAFSSAVMISVFSWVGRRHYVYSDFMYTHKAGFKKGIILLATFLIIIISGLVKNKGREFAISFEVLKAMPPISTDIITKGIGFGEPIFEEVFKNVPAVSELPYVFRLFFQTGILGIILLIWVGFQLVLISIKDLFSTRPDQQWVGVLGVGLMVSIFSVSFFSHIELGTITIPASLMIATLYGLKRFLKF